MNIQEFSINIELASICPSTAKSIPKVAYPGIFFSSLGPFWLTLGNGVKTMKINVALFAISFVHVFQHTACNGEDDALYVYLYLHLLSSGSGQVHTD
jgi:hypothetical protein